MPNVSLTFRCNLRCPYCFAHEFVEEAADDITLENFDAALEFLTRTRPVHLGLIGGEPTLHPQFGEILARAAGHERVTGVTVYTNGILLDRFFDEVTHPKVSLLVNWNSPEMLGERPFARVRDAVDELVFNRHMEHRLNLGLNLHGEATDYGYLIELLRRYGLHKVRVSLTVPDFPQGCTTDTLSYFRAHKAFLLALIEDMDAADVLPYYDCNRPPWCIWTDEEKRRIAEIVAKRGTDERYGDAERSLLDTKSFCRPVIDITPDLQAVRCFGMAYFEKVPISEFATLDELQAHFMRRIDRRAFRIRASEECENCPWRRTWQCSQGCMGFKGNEIERLIAEAGEAPVRR